MSQIIAGHNRKLLDKLSPKNVQPCTCRKQTCPVQGKCKQECTIYQATVTHSSPETGKKQTNTYIGLAATTFYQRHQNHKTSFKDKNHSTKSELSKHIWNLKELGLVCDVTWKIIDKGKKFSPTSKSCKLCTLERYYLICRPDLYTLNKNKEFSDECLHKRFLRLSKVKWKLDHYIYCSFVWRPVEPSLVRFCILTSQLSNVVWGLRCLALSWNLK